MSRARRRKRSGRGHHPGPQSPAVSWREYLLAENPSSPLQARLRQGYLAALAFARNRLALVGLAIVALLVLTALLAPLLALQSPATQDLTARLQPPDAARWFGTDEL